MQNLRLDDLQVNNLKIWQDPELFCFGTDAVLLANFVRPSAKDKLLDIGTGNAIIPILISAKSNVSDMTGLEILEKSFLLAEKNVEFNNLNDKIKIIHGDINDEALFSPGAFTYITCNPPYKPQNTGLKNPAAPLAIARHEILCTLEDIISRSGKLLCSKGRLALVHKPERLAEIIYLMKQNGIEPKIIQTVCSREGEPPCLILIEGMKHGGAGIKWIEPLCIYDRDGNYTATCKALYEKTKENLK